MSCHLGEKGGPRWPGIQGGASCSTRTEGCPARNPSIMRFRIRNPTVH